MNSRKYRSLANSLFIMALSDRISWKLIALLNHVRTVNGSFFSYRTSSILGIITILILFKIYLFISCNPYWRNTSMHSRPSCSSCYSWHLSINTLMGSPAAALILVLMSFALPRCSFWASIIDFSSSPKLFLMPLHFIIATLSLCLAWRCRAHTYSDRIYSMSNTSSAVFLWHNHMSLSLDASLWYLRFPSGDCDDIGNFTTRSPWYKYLSYLFCRCKWLAILMAHSWYILLIDWTFAKHESIYESVKGSSCFAVKIMNQLLWTPMRVIVLYRQNKELPFLLSLYYICRFNLINTCNPCTRLLWTRNRHASYSNLKQGISVPIICLFIQALNKDTSNFTTLKTLLRMHYLHHWVIAYSL